MSSAALVGRLSALLMLAVMSATSHAQVLVGPATEERFPPLTVPDGFRATLFACDPLIEYPSVIALGPDVGSLFVAHDYMTGLGVETHDIFVSCIYAYVSVHILSSSPITVVPQQCSISKPKLSM